MAKTSNSWLETVAGLFYPPVCQLCRVEPATPVEGFVCRTCRLRPGNLRYVRPPFCQRCGLPFDGEISAGFECANCRDVDLHFVNARAAVVATPLVLEVVHRYKYNRAMWFEPFLADLLVGEMASELREGRWDVVVPVPLFPVKEREREFNQAERLARRLGEAADVPVNARLIRRVQPTRTQTLLSRTERARNVGRAFAPWPGARLRRQRVVLVDDVLTTGATTNACARVLRHLGASEVCVRTVARGT